MNIQIQSVEIILIFYPFAGYPRCPFQLLWDTPARFMGQLFILMGMGESIDRGRDCEAADRTEVGLALKEDVTNLISLD